MNKKIIRKMSKSAIVIMIAIIAAVLACMQINLTSSVEFSKGNITLMSGDGVNVKNPVSADLAEGYEGKGYNDDDDIGNMAATAINTCNDLSSSHGLGRDNGYSSTFLDNGCRHYQGFPYDYTYGSSNIPYYINPAGMSEAKQSAIRAQAELWNQAVMHDGTGQIVNLYEVNNKNAIDGKPVCEILIEDLENYDKKGSNAAGLFYPSPYYTLQIKLHEGGYSSDTPMHEMGHLLGLWDLDINNVTSHKSIMAYNRRSKGIVGKLQYQDIQGIALFNNRHTEHQYDRYALENGRYLHFCFYCDLIEDSSTALSNAKAMINASTCDHFYQDLVSAGDRHWVKCINCYKVVDNHELTRVDAYGQASPTLSARNLSLDFDGYGNNTYVNRTFVIGAGVKYLYIKNMKNLSGIEFVIQGDTVITIARSNFFASDNSTAIDAADRNIEIYCIGNNVVTGGRRSMIVFTEQHAVKAKSLTIYGAANATMALGGGVGENASGESSYSMHMNGARGSVAVQAESLKINNIMLLVVGGNGGKGYRGINGVDSTEVAGVGTAGKSGGIDGDGAAAIRVTGSIFEIINAEVWCYGGIGGNGATGGIGGCGGKGATGAAGSDGKFLVAATKGGTGGKGGSGGKGGAGGAGGKGASSYIGVAPTISAFGKDISFINGSGGVGGIGGSGGKGGIGGDGGAGGRKWNSSNYAPQGDRGAQGNTGSQGQTGATGASA